MLPQVPACSDTPFFWVETEEQLKECLNKMNKELETCPLLAVDFEYFNASPGQEGCGALSLIQLSTETTDYILDPFTLRNAIRI